MGIAGRQRLAQRLPPGPLPHRVLVTGLILLGVTLVMIAVLVWLGIVWHATPSKYFRERRAGTYYSGALLIAAGAVAVGVASRTEGPSSRRFWHVAAAGFVYLALDDVLTIHEEIDRGVHALLGWDPGHWLTDHLDDAIVAVYGIVAVVWTYWHRTHVLRLRWTTLLLAAAFAGFTAMTALDFAGWSPTVEESLKLIAETFIVIALLAALHDPALRETPS